MYSRIPGSILSDNSQYPIFSSTSDRLDQMTLGLFQTGILQIGKFEREISINEMKAEKERSEQFQILSMQWFTTVLDTRKFRESQIVFDRYWNDVVYPIIREIHQSKSEPFFMAWNDHAFALRTMMLSKLYVLGDKKMRERVRSLLVDSISFLSDEKNYDQLSNHGWDQAKALLIASKLIGNDTDLAINRFSDELANAFSTEGIHVENSPHYHIHMMDNLVNAIELFVEMGIDNNFVHKMIKVAKTTILYYHVILRENGTIPSIGDSYIIPPKFNATTRNFIEKNPINYTSYGFYPFPETGYCYWRANWDDFNVHLSLKNSHLSRYHRHDDDLSLTLNIGGVDVFIDGGLYKYEEKNEHRIFLRSPFSHSTIVLPEYKPQRKLGYEINNSSENESQSFTAKSSMWEGRVISRNITMIHSNQFNIQDSVDPDADGFEILFQTICEDIRIDGENVVLNYEKFSVCIDFSCNEEEVVKIGVQKSIYSPQYDQLLESSTVVCTTLGNQLNYSIIFKRKE